MSELCAQFQWHHIDMWKDVLFHRKELHRKVCDSPVIPCTQVSCTWIQAGACSPFCLLSCFAALCTISFSTVTLIVFPCISSCLPCWSKVTIFQIIKIYARIHTNDGKMETMFQKKRKQTQLYLYHLPFLILKQSCSAALDSRFTMLPRLTLNLELSCYVNFPLRGARACATVPTFHLHLSDALLDIFVTIFIVYIKQTCSFILFIKIRLSHI